jgi:transmembrane sensor
MDHRKRIEDFYAGKLSPEQALEFLNWLESHEAEEFLSADIIQFWKDKPQAHEESWDNQPLWQKINTEKSGFSKPYLTKSTNSHNPNRKRAWLKYAAALVIMGVSCWVGYSLHQKTESIQVSEQVQKIKFITRNNPAGQKTKILLSDGSTIYLNSESSVTYPEDFQGNRRVTLIGEAFFDVAKNSEHPFTVESKGITTTALGTSFNISTFNRQDKVAVTLVTGKVKLQQLGSTEELELLPGEESILAVDELRPNKYRVNTRDRILWTEGVLKFQQTSFIEIVEVLQRWYGVKIKVHGHPEADVATGTFDNNESLRNVLMVLGESLNFSYELNEKEVIIHF